ncbi:hypothetical protein [Extensimonas sp. H3M7-6]|uniref:hypothetical protein n=1 Tax=Extensimonas soli TaxID=3031322 RepID=UPI0023DBF84A|nr:hypothetical protein [Extensimonas sp. H3M7-6]MDF1483262.1 hypothetical protein [Extensimonas sp. H3M7-6]
MNRSSKKLVGDGKPHERRHPLEGGGVRITTFVPFHFKKRGIKKVIVAPEGVSQPIAVTDTPVLTPEQDRPLLKALGRGIYWQQLIDNGTVASGTEIAERECIHRSTVNDLLRLALLAPDIIQAAYEGRLPRAVSLEAILRAKVPLDWNEQRQLIASFG